MQVLVRTGRPERLVLELVPARLWGYWLFGLLFMALGVWSAGVLGRAVRLDCDRTAAGRTCRFALASLGSGWSAPREVALLGARVRTVTMFLYAGQTLLVRTGQGELPVPLVGAGGGAKDSLAAALNALAEGRGEPVTVHEDYRLLGATFGAVLVLAGALCLVAIETVRVVFDRAAGQVRLAQRRWFRTTRSSVELARVKGVAKQEFTVGRARSCSVTLLLDGGAELALTRTPLFTEESAEKTMSTISAWLA